MAVPIPPPPSAPQQDLTEIRAQLASLEERIKENQTSLFAAIKTALNDINEYRQGKRDLGSLRPAALGLLFAYLRPRLVVLVGSMLAALLGFAQLWFLWNQQKQIDQQNRLIEQQGYVMEAQTRANQVAALSDLVLALDPRDSIRSHLAQVQLAEFGEAGTNVLMRLAESPGPTSSLAAQALYGQGDIHSPAQAAEVLNHWAQAGTRELHLLVSVPPPGAPADTGRALAFLRATQPLIREYVWDLTVRVRSDTAFSRQLRAELLNRKPPPGRDDLPTVLAGLYGTYLRACRVHPSSRCEAGRQVPSDPPSWHTEIHYLATSFASPGRTADASRAYALLAGDGPPDQARLYLLIRAWFTDPRGP